MEMALILPLLLLLVFGIIEFGWMLRCYQAVGQTAREGARSGAVNSTTAVMDSRVDTTAQDVYDLDPTKIVTRTYEYRTAVRASATEPWGPFPTGGNGGPAWSTLTTDGAGNNAKSDDKDYSQIRVTLTYRYPLITGGMFSWLNGGNSFITLKQSIVMRKE